MLENLGPIIIGIVLVLVLSASMSTLSSLVLTSGSTVTLDLIAPLKRKPMSEKSKMLIMRLLIVCFVIISALIAVYQVNAKSGSSVTFIANLMGVSWGALAGSFIGPFLWGLYSKNVTRASVYTSFVVGVLMSIIQLIRSLTGFNFGVLILDNLVFKTSIHSGSIAMILSLLLVPIVSLFTKKQSPEEIEEIFNCYKKTVTVKATEVLKIEEEQ